VRKAFTVRGCIISAGLVLLLVMLRLRMSQFQMSLGQAAFASGWLLFSMVVFLASYNARKRLSMLPLGSASTALLLHLAVGLAAVIVFWVHTGGRWPMGHYEQVLALLFCLVSLSGLLGFILQKLYPRILTATGSRSQIIAETMPAELASLREQADDIWKKSGSRILGQYYSDRIEWFLRKPRFFFYNAVGSARAEAWHRQQRANIQHLLNEQEQKHFDQLTELVEHKQALDVQYAGQIILKGWLLVHVPLAAALVVLSIWHLIVVHVYAL
jgi:hypothetical protein